MNWVMNWVMMTQEDQPPYDKKNKLTKHPTKRERGVWLEVGIITLMWE